ncbi:iron ABC transporter permease [Chitinibacter bivalviorum]|uniref:Iron ABC transporter permease n=1 Tax=Chitinibacter bivalviorum TaxID=2739434 RepID=A0A7H9BFT2_9NEIS|nr:iron ABC transporter permease [Chitinibacter bivalviorum]QLG87447.1 iron ABC transporter permease [Chitinibacter bivalviorum]
MKSARLTPQKVSATMAVLLLLMLLAIAASLCFGSTNYRPWQLWSSADEAALARDVVLELRLPRTLAALAVGGLLALAGTLQQVLLRNPLADPYILGTSGGASVGALLALLLGVGTLGVNLAAGGGALASIIIVFLLAGRDHSATQTRLLLTGVALAAFCGALSSLLLSMAPDGLLRGMIFWLMGDLAGAHWQSAMVMLLVLLIGIWPLARELNIMGMSSESAFSLGLNHNTLRWILYFAAALACALAVTTAGMIGFVGLIVPHALRLIIGQDLRLLLPAAAMAGGVVLLLADILARTLIAPQQLPVGVVMALLGVPVFLWLLSRKAGGRR